MSAKPSRQELLRQLQELENENIEDLEETNVVANNPPPTPTDSIDALVQAPKKPRTAKQLEAFEKAKAIRDANYAKRKEEAERKAEEDRKLLEEKLVKKAIAVKKKQIKQQKILDEIPSDDDTPVQKTKQPLVKVNPSPVVPALKITFF
jgi:hypothetical protein